VSWEIIRSGPDDGIRPIRFVQPGLDVREEFSMENATVSIERIQPFRPLTARTTNHSKAVQKLFVELVGILERLRESPSVKSNEGTLERWEDEEYIYLETDLGSVSAPEIDVNVHDGRVYIRMAR
jgi:HSP20 family molecular chaperone IbpA